MTNQTRPPRPRLMTATDVAALAALATIGAAFTAAMVVAVVYGWPS